MTENTPKYGSTSKEAFLKRVSASLDRTSTPASLSEAPPEIDLSIARLAEASDDLVAMFTERATSVSMHVHKITSDQLVDTLKTLLNEKQAKSLTIASEPDSPVASLAESLAGDFDIVDWKNKSREEGIDAQYDVDAGITDVRAALAETGTMVYTSGENHSRGPSLIPHYHFPVVRKSDIVPDMFDYFKSIEGKTSNELPASQAFITGPSKTADIEGILIEGVHGPKQVHILLLEDA